MLLMFSWSNYVVSLIAEARQLFPFAYLNVVKYLLVKHNDKSAAIPILVIYFMLFIPMTVCFLRLVHITVFHPPYIQLGPAALRDRQGYKKRGTARPEENGIAMGEYNPGNNSGGTLPEITGSNNDPGSPGLELFYTKDIFVCNTDGLPIWCSECCNWYVLPGAVLHGTHVFTVFGFRSQTFRY